jgi:hypothetical protein
MAMFASIGGIDRSGGDARTGDDASSATRSVQARAAGAWIASWHIAHCAGSIDANGLLTWISGRSALRQIAGTALLACSRAANFARCTVAIFVTLTGVVDAHETRGALRSTCTAVLFVVGNAYLATTDSRVALATGLIVAAILVVDANAA